MSEKTIAIIKTLYVVGWIIFLVWKTFFPNSEGVSLSSLICEALEDSPFSPGVSCAILIGLSIVITSIWPYWVISYPIKKFLKK